MRIDASHSGRSLAETRKGWRIGSNVASGIVLVAMSGCASLDTAAPPVGTLTGPAASLASGRALYIGRCAKCHAAEPVHDYSAAQWAKIIPDMAERTKLTPAETADLEAYVDAVLKTRRG